MKKLILIIILMAIASYGFTETRKPGSGALIFNMENLLLDIDSYNDGIQPGMGLKFWILENLALRALLAFESVTDLDNSVEPPEPISTRTNLMFGVAGEFHFIPGEISPYAGGMFGLKMITTHFTDENVEDPETFMDYYFGALFGVEAQIKDFKFLSIFAEYALIADFREQETSVTLGAGGSGKIGVLFYFM
ncbi:MAG: hypothetical protein JXR70_16375 [Spirochaetales bacterium]|nr:hypothetical protein [Spirochaetales bacterium]